MQTVLSASSLKEACKMDWKEKLQDMCDGGVKKAAITRLYNQITQSDGKNPSTQVERFVEMRQLASPNSRANFSIQTFGQMGDEQAQVRLFVVSGNTSQSLYQGQLANNSAVSDCIKKRDVMLAENCVIKTKLAVKKQIGEGTLTPTSYCTSKIQCMSDDPSIREKLTNELTSSHYSKENFSHCIVNKDNTFTAHFKGGETLVFSNRTATNNEFRAGNLMTALKENDYDNLQALIEPGYLTEEDALLRSTVSMIKGDLFMALGIENPKSMYIPDTKIPDPKAWAQYHHATAILHNTPVGNTTLGKLFGTATPSVNNGSTFTNGLQQCQTTTKGDRIQTALTENTQAGLAQLTAEIHHSKASSHSFGGLRLFG